VARAEHVEPHQGPRGERGTVTPLIVGFASLLLVAGAVVIDASAAFIQRQGLDTLADGAALRGADLGVQGAPVYREGVRDAPLVLSSQAARAAVGDYLGQVGAYARYPGLRVAVSVTATRVEVDLDAPLDLPLSVPGAPGTTMVGASGSAVVDPEAPGV